MNIYDMPYVLGIAVICYWVGSLIKACPEIQDKWIPVIVMGVGGIIGIPAMYIMKDFPAQDIISAIAVGIVSGAVSIAGNQLMKQAKKQPGEDNYEIPVGTLEFGDEEELRGVDDGK